MESPNLEMLFNRALDLAAGPPREAFLCQVYAQFPEWRGELEALLQAHESAGDFLMQPLPVEEPCDIPTALAALTNDSPAAPTLIGPYRIVQCLGQGGMGTVYLAEQREPVRRQVALKLVKSGLGSERILRRFEAERQALACMEHDHIAKVYDAGNTATGQPYFVMELIKGVPLTTYCRQTELSIADRLALLIPVCHAVHHAHQRGIIHRDLKPSNILVAIQDGRPVPKVIDFGVAKAVHQPLTSATLATEIGSIVGTLEYMSPEQAELNRLDVDTRADVYALGAVLYELLTDTTPLRPAAGTRSDLLTMLTAIRESVPIRPSLRLTMQPAAGTPTAASRQAAQLVQDFRSDLDWIVMKCLEKERTRRYESPRDLAADLERYLRKQPVAARAPSWRYRWSKLYARRKTVFRLAGVIAALSLGLLLVGIQSYRSSVEAERRRSENQLALATNQALRQLDDVQAAIEQGDNIRAFELLQQIARWLPAHPRLPPLLEQCSQEFRLTSDPPGAALAYRSYLGDPGAWTVAGHTAAQPLVIRLPKQAYLWRAELAGFAPSWGLRPPDAVHFELARSHEGMVRIPGGRWQSPIFWFMYQVNVKDLSPFWIDRYEVTNADFARFVAAGGYRQPEWWSGLEFVAADRPTRSWEEALTQLVDSTGQPGPAGWSHGTYPPGAENLPVTGVSWYEAMAYARFVGKRLPSACQWEFAARPEQAAALTDGEILDQFQFGSAPRAVAALTDWGLYGTLGLGGNAKEWTETASAQGDRLLLGGGYGETLYTAVTPDHRPPFCRDANIGFRCAAQDTSNAAEPLEVVRPVAWPPTPDREQLLDRRTFDIAIANRCAYNPALPLQVVEETREEAECWHTIAHLNCAYTDREGAPERMVVHLYLPKTPPPPGGFQTLLYLPPIDAGFLRKIRPLEQEYGLDSFLRSGRAVCRPVVCGTYQRSGVRSNDPEQARICALQDVQRTIDYLQHRNELARAQIAVYGFSWGGDLGLAAMAIDRRICAGIFQGVGLSIRPLSTQRVVLETAYALPFVAAPVLMIGGQGDELRPPDRSQQPLLELLGSTDKSLITLEGGHLLPGSQVVQLAETWLDERWGAPPGPPAPPAQSAGFKRR